MKKLFSIIALSLIFGCSGYKPMFSTNELNFYISEISNSSNDRILNQIVKKLEPYKKDNGKREIRLNINSNILEKVSLRDSKGDPSVYEIMIEMKIIVTLPNDLVQNFLYSEKININNQNNKFEFQQYKNSLKKNAVDKIFEKLILNLRSL